MFISTSESSVFTGKYIKQLTMRQLLNITDAKKADAGYNQVAEMVYLSYFNDAACTQRMFNNGGDALDALPPNMFNAAVNEVMVFNGISEGNTETENPT
jgi:hypothetical protein